MITKLFSRSALHEHADPAQRMLGLAQLPPDSNELARLVASDPAPEVRAAAARRCADLAALSSAWKAESDPAVRAALAAGLAAALSEAPDADATRAVLDAEECTDAIRVDVARRATDTARRGLAIASIRGQDPLVELALGAEHAETRMAAAERVHAPEQLRRLADAARNKDHGVARHARQRADAMTSRADRESKADAVLDELEALATRPGPILTAVIDLDRRWQALDLTGDADRLARCDAARAAIQARFDREQEEQRTRARYERRVRDWLAALTAAAGPETLDEARTELAALRAEAPQLADEALLAGLDQGEQRIAELERERQASQDAEALVVEAEQLAAATSIDNAKLPERWQALNRSIRTPALTRRFEAALTVVEQRRLEQIRAAQQEASVARAHVHALLHTAEQALAAGQLQSARAAVDEIRTRKANAGALPKPTTQRLSRLLQQLQELERWESFGQQNARLQLCERAEVLVTQTLDAPQLALEIQKLRAEWKALDALHAGVPKTLWQRFDSACEKAYAPAARHFAEVAAQRKQARKQRDDFIAMSAAHVETLLAEPRDWRAIERWLRETDQTWREGALGSVDPGAWKKLDARQKAALAPLRDALSAAREQAKAGRVALIAEATALAAKAMDRDAPSQVKAIQARWQEQAKALALPQRDERALWEQFRVACDAVFAARVTRRKEDDGRKNESRRALEDLCALVEQLATATDKPEPEVRRALREAQDQWKKSAGGFDPSLRAAETRFKSASTAVESMLAARTRSRAAAVWSTLAAKERLCEALDEQVAAASAESDPAANPVHDAWSGLPALPPAWEQKLCARRDAALAALADPAARERYRARMEQALKSRAGILLELEMLLAIASPPDLQAQRLALQVQQLRDRFQGAAKTGAPTAGDRLVAWCAEPGVAEPRDRQRVGPVFAAIEKLR